MALKVWQLISIVLSALVAGMFCGPWVALTRSITAFEPRQFLVIVRHLNRNMAQVMTILMPVSVLSILPVLFLSVVNHPATFFLSIASFALFIAALLVTTIIEVPIVKQIDTWTVATLPANWEQLRDRWSSFHLIRIAASIAGLALLAAAAIF